MGQAFNPISLWGHLYSNHQRLLQMVVFRNIAKIYGNYETSNFPPFILSSRSIRPLLSGEQQGVIVVVCIVTYKLTFPNMLFFFLYKSSCFFLIGILLPSSHDK